MLRTVCDEHLDTAHLRRKTNSSTNSCTIKDMRTTTQDQFTPFLRRREITKQLLNMRKTIVADDVSVMPSWTVSNGSRTVRSLRNHHRHRSPRSLVLLTARIASCRTPSPNHRPTTAARSTARASIRPVVLTRIPPPSCPRSLRRPPRADLASLLIDSLLLSLLSLQHVCDHQRVSDL